MSKNSFEVIVQRRIGWILLFFLAIFSLLLGRFFLLQIVNYREYSKAAAKQQRLVKDILSERGMIYARDTSGTSVALAFNRMEKVLVASPKDIKDPQKTAAFIAKELKLNEIELVKRFSLKNDAYEVVAKRVTPEEAERIERAKLAGIFFEDERRRIYPYGTLGAHLLGFVSKEVDEEEGRYGIESFYDDDLAGIKGLFEGVKGASGFWIALGKRIVKPPKNGSSILLSIDYNIQQKAGDTLSKLKGKWDAASGAVLIVEPKTGRILALSADPAFDPNDFSKEKSFSVFLNPLVESSYELGSVLKPITLAGGLQEGVVKPDTTYEDPGAIKIGGYKINNFDGKAHGIQTMTQVLEKSLNTGAVHVARLLGRERQAEYLKKFGFGVKAGVDLPGEVAGNLSNLKSGHEIDFATASFGQGIAVTPLQLAMAIGAIANEGKLMRPFVVEKITDDSGNERKIEPQLVREVVSKDTAETLTKMLVSVVRAGFDNKAGVKGYFVAGKTGTAQIPRGDAPGYSDKVIHTFVGYAPAFNPRFLILLQLNEPKGNRFAANTLTPAFHDLAEYILNYYEVPPDEK